MGNIILPYINIIIVLYNLITAYVDSTNDYYSIISVIILAYNMFVSISSIKNNRNKKVEIICLILEIITLLVILSVFL